MKRLARIRVDQNTGVTAKGMFARICDEVDITKPLLPKFKLRHGILRIEYEGSHLVCFTCGIFNDNKEGFPNTAVVVAKAPTATEGEVKAINGDEHITSHQIRKENIFPLEIKDDFGPWMLAPRKVHRNGKSKDGKK